MIDLSIIVPVYQVEQYIRPCLESLFRQSLDEKSFEIIIVNDGTTDHSIDVISDIIEQHSNITVINQENQGLSVARNIGINKATGKYILMIDSDDLLIDNSLPKLLNLATENNVDILVANFLEMYDEEIANIQNITQQEIVIKEKTGEQLFLEDLDANQCYVWRSLYRKNFILDNHIYFIPGIFYQDVPFTHECYLKADRCIRTTQLLNIYRKGRPGAATYSFSTKKAKDLCIVIAKTWELRKYHRHTTDTLLKLENDVFASFSLLITLVSYSIKDSFAIKEIINSLKEQSPDLYFKNGISQQITSLFFKTMPSFFINMNVTYRKIKKIIKNLL